MDYRGIIDFHKYTLAVAGGGLFYAFNLVPKLTDYISSLVVFMTLFLFFISALFAVIIFSTATKALHNDKNAKRKKIRNKIIRCSATIHYITLFIAVIALGVVMIADAYTQLGKPAEKPECTSRLCPGPQYEIRPHYWPAVIEPLAL